MKKFITHQHRRFGFALKGLCTAYHTDLNFKLLVRSIFFYPIFGYVVWPLTQTEILFLALSYTLIVVTELQNTSFEKALNRLHPERHDDIGASKDIVAASVLAAGIFALMVVLVITVNRFA